VYVDDAAGKVQDKTVALGIQTANYAEVTKGLEKAEHVVVSDRSGLKPGQPVKAHQIQAMTYEGSAGDQ
jgi:hypothetical protein